MIDLFGIITRTFLGLSPAPATTHTHTQHPHSIVSAPLFATPGIGSAAGTAALSASDTVDKVQQFYATIKQVGRFCRLHVAEHR